VTRAALPEYLQGVALDQDCPYVLTADLAVPLGLVQFSRSRPDRFLDVGIAEQCLVAVAAGLASTGHPAVATTFASFAMRGLEAFRNLVMYDDLHVVLVGANGGIATGPNGPTHQATEDLGVFGSLERVKCFSPRSVPEAVAVLAHTVSNHGQYYVRLARWEPPRTREPTSDVVETDKAWEAFYGDLTGAGVAVLSHGVTWNIACDVVDAMRSDGHSAVAAHVGCIPVATLGLTAETVVTVEDHYSYSGLGRLAPLLVPGAKRYVNVGAPWPLGSDDAEVLYDAAGLSVTGVLDRLAATQ